MRRRKASVLAAMAGASMRPMPARYAALQPIAGFNHQRVPLTSDSAESGAAHRSAWSTILCVGANDHLVAAGAGAYPDILAAVGEVDLAIDGKRITALMVTASRGHVGIVKTLLAHKDIEIDCTDAEKRRLSKGNTARPVALRGPPAASISRVLFGVRRGRRKAQFDPQATQQRDRCAVAGSNFGDDCQTQATAGASSSAQRQLQLQLPAQRQLQLLLMLPLTLPLT